MTVESLLVQYDFHDNSLVAIKYEQGTLQLVVNLCMWRQNEYKKGEPELKEITVCFKNIKAYNWDSEKEEFELDYDEILQITYIDNIVKVVLYDEIISILSFECSDVIIIN